MAKENESHRGWRIEPCTNPVDWWTVGYPYEGIHGSHQGEFVPVHHWADRPEAESCCAALLAGGSRDEAKAKAVSA